MGCSARPPAGTEAGAEGLAVEYGGCSIVVTADDEPTCVLEADRLGLWLEDPEAERAEVWLDEQRVEPEHHHPSELPGLGLVVDVPAEAARVRVVLHGEHGRTAEWSLRLSHDGPTPWIVQASTAIEHDLLAGRITQGLQGLEALRAAAPSSTETLDAALAVAHHLATAAHDPLRAEALLRDYEALARRSPRGRAELALTQGMVSWRLGRLDEAAIAYREAARHALRTRNARLELAALVMYAELLAELGYLGAAAHWARHVRDVLEAPTTNPGDLGSAARTLGWIGLLLREAGRRELDPEGPYRDAMEVFGPGGTAPDPDKVGGVRLGLARVALDDDDPADALAELARIDPRRVTPDEHAHALGLEVRARLQQGADAAAVAPRLDQLAAIVHEVGTPQARWQLAVLRGRVAERSGEVEAAIAHYQHAEALYDEVSQLAVFGAGRSTSGALSPEATQRLIDVLVTQGRLHEALCAARLSRARALRPLVLPASLDPAQREELRAQARAYLQLEAQANAMEREGRARPGRELQRRRRDAEALRQALQQRANALALARGSLAAQPRCEDLTSRAPGELLLALHPVEGGWAVLTEDDQGLAAHRVREPSELGSRTPQELSRMLLEPIREPLARARRIRVTAIGDAVHVDVHALPVAGAPLSTRAAVSYAVELWGAAGSPPQDPPAALLLGDATGSLWAVSPELQAAEQHLHRAGWVTRVPTNPGSLPQVLGDLTHADLFHYAGHADAAMREADIGLWPPYAGGAPGWPSYLQLEPPARLDVQEILGLERAPRWVVLNGCRTGVVDVQNAGISLALAFLIAGSEQVLASSEATEDLAMGELGRRLYEGATPDEPLDLAERLQRVLQERVAAGESIGRLRVWVR